MAEGPDDAAPAAGEGEGVPQRLHVRRRSGKVYGPYDAPMIIKMLEDGSLLGNEEVSPDAQSWQPLGADPRFAPVLARLMQAPPKQPGAPPPPVLSQEGKGPSVDQLNQVYAGRMATVAVVQSAEPIPFKKRLPKLLVITAVAALIIGGITVGFVTPYGFFFFGRLFPPTVSADSKEFIALKAARSALAEDTFASFRSARDQAGQALKTKEFPEARAVWIQAVGALERRYRAGGSVDLEKGAAALPQVLFLGEKNLEVIKAQASHALATKNADAALAFLEVGLATPEGQADPELAFLHAETLFAKKQLEPAKADAAKLVKADPKCARALHLLGQIALAQGKPDDAIARFIEASTAEPRHASSFVALAELELLTKHERAKGLAAAEQALSDEHAPQLAASELSRAYALKAEVAVLDGKPADSVLTFEQAIKADPVNAFANALLGEAYLKLHEPQKAIPLFRTALQGGADNLEATTGLLAALIESGKADDAAAVLATAESKFANAPAILYWAGRTAALHDEAKKAEDFFKRAIAADPKTPEPYLELARMWMRFRRFTDARALIDDALKTIDDSGGLHALSAELALVERDFTKADVESTKAVGLSPELAEAHVTKSRVALEAGDAALALTEAEKALALNPHVADGLQQKGTALWKLGRLDDALTELRSAREAEPDNRMLEVIYCAVLIDKREAATALPILSKAVLRDHAPTEAFYYLARARHATKDFPGAIETMKTAVDRDGKNTLYRYWLGRIYADTEKLDDAMAQWKLALELDPKYADALEARGKLHFDRGALNLAIEDFQKALAVDPNRLAVRALLGDTYGKVPNLDKAIAEYLQVVAKDPQSKDAPGVPNNLAKAYDDKGKKKEAVAWYKKAVELDPMNGEALRRLGYLCVDLKQYKDGVAAFRAFLQTNPDAAAKKEIEEEIDFVREKKHLKE